MKIKYTFVTGEIIEIEVDDCLGAEIQAIDHQANLKDRAETRRHIQLSTFDYEDARFFSCLRRRSAAAS